VVDRSALSLDAARALLPLGSVLVGLPRLSEERLSAPHVRQEAPLNGRQGVPDGRRAVQHGRRVVYPSRAPERELPQAPGRRQRMSAPERNNRRRSFDQMLHDVSFDAHHSRGAGSKDKRCGLVHSV
jgi:hypothetical protein